MGIYRGTTPMVAFKGDHGPVNIYRGNNKVAGWVHDTQTGSALTFATTYSDKVDELIVVGNSVQENPMINQIPENRRKFEGWSAHNGATVTLTQNVSVPEWGTNEATRIQTSGGNSSIKCAYSAGQNPLNRIVMNRLYIKNIGDKTVRILMNQEAVSGYVRLININPGQSQFVELVGQGAMGTSTLLSWQIIFWALNASDNLDFIVWKPEMFVLDLHPTYPWPVQSVSGNLIVSDGAERSQTVGLMELCKVGDVADTYNPITGELVQRVWKHVFDGTEDGIEVYDTAPYEGWRFAPAVDSGIPEMHPMIRGAGLCTHLPNYYNTSAAFSRPCVWFGVDNRWIYFVRTSDIVGATIESIRAYLAAQYANGTPVTVYYQLKTPIVSYVTPAELETYYPETHIYTTSDIAPHISATVKIIGT